MISFVIPIYNEEESILELFNRLSAVLDQVEKEYKTTTEVILVDDGSRDRSLSLMKQVSSENLRFKILSLSRNFGHQAALTAGLEHAQGEAVIAMDADLQDPPELVFEMLKKWSEGADVVYAQRIKRAGETWFKKITAALYYRLLKSLTKVSVPADTGDFRLIDRKVLNAFVSLKEKNRFIRGLFAWLGYKQVPVYYERQARFAGVTKYPLNKMLKLAFDGMISMSTTPLHVVFYMGVLISALSFLGGGVALTYKAMGHEVSIWLPVMAAISFFAGLQIAILGIISEYIGRIVDEVRDRPIYLLKENTTSVQRVESHRSFEKVA